MVSTVSGPGPQFRTKMIRFSNDKACLEGQQMRFDKKTAHFPDEYYHHQRIHIPVLQYNLHATVPILLRKNY